MLLRYIVENFKSIGKGIEFTMFPTKDIKDKKFISTLKTRNGNWEVLKRAAFFGPNASGKSNFIKSLAFVKNFILEGQLSEKTIRIEQFKGNLEELDNKSVFQFMMYIDGEVYEYGFVIDRKQVYEEWLMILTEDDLEPIFKRETNKDGVTMIELNEGSKRFFNEDESEVARVLIKGFSEKQKNLLYLSKLNENANDIGSKIIDWFKRIQIIFPTTKVQALPIRIKQDNLLKEFISKKLEILDTGVINVTVSEEKNNLDEIKEKLKLPEKIVQDIEDTEHGIVVLNGKYYIFIEENGEKSFGQLKFEHKLENKIVDFDIDDESDGTQRVIDLLPMLFRLEEKKNSMYFIDELDRSLHTKISKYLIQYFLEANEGFNNQLFFTSHDINLLTLDDLIQDEIWFIEKNRFGETKIKPFSNFLLEEGQNTLKDYINGRFGAIPVIRSEKIW